VELIGSTGPNALSDFPHSRFNCVNFIFNDGPIKFCSQCYCYVCDTLASECKTWSTHCQANHQSADWRQQRKQARAQKKAPPSSSSSSTSSLVSAHVSRANTYQSYLARRARMGKGEQNLQSSLMQRVMDACVQIYPLEIAAPTGILSTCKLRTYQKQSLAFMVNREKGTHDDDYKSAPIKRHLFRRQAGKSDYSHAFHNVKTGILGRMSTFFVLFLCSTNVCR
jgi:hypothetical protein